MIKLVEDRRGVPGVALGGIWVGTSYDEQTVNLKENDIGAVLNVAQDLISTRLWPGGTEAMHVGLVDGPGNELTAYYTAVLALHTLMRRHNVLVCCHSGGRSMVVAVMYLNTQHQCGWEQWLDILGERCEELYPINSIHRLAFEKMNWKLLKSLMEHK